MPITIYVRIRTRDAMNSGTPRFGRWTYHHVHPVRIYYLIANTMLGFITDSNCYAQTRDIGTDALCTMCNNLHNKTTIRNFVSQYNDGTTDAQRHPVAKLCASPPFGGFAGVNPDQRSDDPHDQTEIHKPNNATTDWWETLMRMGRDILNVYNLNLMPAPNSDLNATKEAHEWNDFVLGISGDITFASTVGGYQFNPKDWKLTEPANENWTIVPNAQSAQWNAVRRVWALTYPQMALRVSGEMYSYLDTSNVPVPNMIQRNTVPLRYQGDGDFLYFL